MEKRREIISTLNMTNLKKINFLTKMSYLWKLHKIKLIMIICKIITQMKLIKSKSRFK